MRRIALFAALTAVSFGAVWVWAQGQSVQDGSRFNSSNSTGSRSTTLVPQLIGGVIRADTTSKALTMNDDGTLATKEGSPARDDVQLFPVFGPVALAAAAADSNSVPIDVHRYRYLKLLIKCYLTNGASNATGRLIFQFREHANSLSDTTSTFAEYQYSSSNLGVALSIVDTTTSGQTVTGSATLPWSGEYIVNFMGTRSSPGNAVAAVVWSYPNGVAIPLDAVMGRPARFNQLSIRVRNGGTAAVNVTVQVLGFAS
jgi:hypothetical protein